MNYWKKKKVCVLGGAGFIGSHLVDLLVKKEAIVTIVDNFSRGKNKNDKAYYLALDLRNYDNCLQAIKGNEIVFNLAAKVTGIAYNSKNHEDMFIENIALQMYPIKAALECKVKKFIQVSTACVYPHDAKIPTSEEEGWKGEPEPTNAGYGWAKRMGERLAFWYSEKGLNCLVIRFFNAIGERDYYDGETSHVVPAIIKKTLNDKEIVIWGTGEQKRVFVDAKDLAKGLILLTEKFKKFDIVNIGHDREISIKELALRIKKIAKIKKPIKLDKSKPNGYERRAADFTKLKKMTNWYPKIPLNKTLKEMINEIT